MATWDFGGGCPCGVSKVCDCKHGYDENGEKKVEEKVIKPITEATPFMMWLLKNKPHTMARFESGIDFWSGPDIGQLFRQTWAELQKLTEQRNPLIEMPSLREKNLAAVELTAAGWEMVQEAEGKEMQERAEYERLKKKYEGK